MKNRLPFKISFNDDAERMQNIDERTASQSTVRIFVYGVIVGFIMFLVADVSSAVLGYNNNLIVIIGLGILFAVFYFLMNIMDRKAAQKRLDSKKSNQ